jgi:aspartyl-tRNA(Asn)/glutamyl-tRNA(Gln) amidotransferase subunit B
MDYEAVIGLEVHAQLKTRTKAFCGCLTEFGNPANTQVCPVCLGLPGSLPVLNEKVLEYGIKTALALSCEVQQYTKFDRKNYFYPDLPKNYQISQYDLPLALKGFLEIKVKDIAKRIGIKRVHLEEDAGKLIHEGDSSLVDYNRAGVALLEIVSEPQLNSSDEAYVYLVSLKAILKYLEVCDCDMEKGSLRCDANISLRRSSTTGLGVKTELKNMNSFKAVRDALGYEIKRQREILEKGLKIVQETRLWDETQEETYTMRRKEEAMDYRYFPDPDLPHFVLGEERIKAIRDILPELPDALKARLEHDYGLSENAAEILTEEKSRANFFMACCALYPEPEAVSNWIIGPLQYELNVRNTSFEALSLGPEGFVLLLKLVDEARVSNLAAKEVLAEMLNTGKGAEVILLEKGLSQVSDTKELSGFIDTVISREVKSVEDYRAGKTNALMFLVGGVMRLSKGKANPKVVQEMLKEKLGG